MVLTASRAASGPEACSRCQALAECPQRSGRVNDDEGAARIFRVLCDPTSLRLLLHVLEVGQCDSDVERLLDLAAGSAALHLDHLVEAGLLVRTPRGDGTDGYWVTDTAIIEGLLETVRQLGARDRKS